ncbi:DUF1801 domain-containing protein [Alterisphingorhabdus coralli]|uniref:DUF1801 domain-containing protein n=1 Tax=Alterisphingorhabdus coralli TaxID=3071408 RepID=A0AA97F5T5_9SPHN|nr:DUF1801 domain-containing protein [Parasphingorhabdus sp. SCSIO 66989]WOE74506.1 DUF1801 domain-containing protein [Parasphingorhabdus sp. SCSIO 66989]
MAENKTQENDGDVNAFINAVEHDGRREDARVLLDLFHKVTGVEPKMWGDSIIGYGSYHYKYDSGREGDFLRTGFSPRKANLSLYIMGSAYDGEAQKKRDALLAKLGKHKMARACLYITRLKNVDMDVLEELIRDDWEHMQRKYPE